MFLNAEGPLLTSNLACPRTKKGVITEISLQFLFECLASPLSLRTILSLTVGHSFSHGEQFFLPRRNILLPTEGHSFAHEGTFFCLWRDILFLTELTDEQNTQGSKQVVAPPPSPPPNERGVITEIPM